MAWTNIFDTGPCNISIWQMAGGGHGTTSYYSGTLGKGQSSPTFAGYSGGSYQLTVDASGLISMACLTGSSGFTPEIRISPTFNLANIPTRFRSIYLDTAAPTVGTYASRFYADSIATANVANDAHLTRASGTSVTPDPASPVLNASANIGGMYVNYAVDVPVGEIAGFIMEATVPVIFAPNETLAITEGSPATTITPVITADGTPVTPTSLAIVTPPVNGTASVSGATLLYTPNANYIGSDSFTYTATYSGITSNVGTVSVAIPANYNCECDEGFPTATLAALRQRMVVRLGYAALLVAPPGLVLLLNDFLTQAQTLLYYKYSCFRTRRWFTWNMTQGQRFYDFGANIDLCRKVLDPRKVEWVGISKGDVNWRELVCGINPVNYRSMQQAIPQFYDIRQCIEIWPAPSTNEWQLRIKGDFGLLPFVADTDVTTIDAEAVFLLALANAKAHYEQPDAGTTMAMATGLIADYTAGSHFTRRYVPGVETLPNAVPPLMKP